jgi:hypothetical protein
MKQAIKGYKALQKLVLPSNFFTGYLMFSKDGTIINSRLIFDNELTEIAEEPIEEKAIVPLPIKIEVADSDEMLLAHLLREKAALAQEQIGPIIHNISTILEDVLEKDSLFLPSAFSELLDLYRTKQEELREGIRQVIQNFELVHPKIKNTTLEYLLREHGLLDFYNSAPPPREDLGLLEWNALQNLKRASFVPILL